MTAPCSVEGCDRPVLARGWCNLHYLRWYRHGDPGSAKLAHAPAGAGHITKQGYVSVVRSDHPLAGHGGKVLLHRVVLYDAIGPGRHACHWCSTPVLWRVGARGGDTLVTDHLDFDRANNDPSNLVPSCSSCNGRRLQRPPVGRWVA